MDLIELFIMILGIVSILMTQLDNQPLNKWAPIIGISGQPLWFYYTYKIHAYGLFVLTIAYTIVWGIGLYNHWFSTK